MTARADDCRNWNRLASIVGGVPTFIGALLAGLSVRSFTESPKGF